MGSFQHRGSGCAIEASYQKLFVVQSFIMTNRIIINLLLIAVLYIGSGSSWGWRRRTSGSRRTSGGGSGGSGGTSSAGAGKACLDQHNVYRALHRKSALQWDSNLARGAQEWANKLASMGSLQHSSGNYGENLAFAFDSRGVQNLGKEAVVRWYEEICDCKGCGFSSGTGHFTQLVWGSSKYLGCAVAKRGNAVFTVARYSPPGNMRGQYQNNVGCGDDPHIILHRREVDCDAYQRRKHQGYLYSSSSYSYVL